MLTRKTGKAGTTKAQGATGSTNRVAIAFLTMLAVTLLVSENTANFAAFSRRVSSLSQQRRSGRLPMWEQVAQYIRDHSRPTDGLYVWGWYPGIYVQAQRFAPSTRPSYSDMHSDSPEVVKQKIEKIVAELKAHPPLFIVDPRKMHYPYNTHPVFDLWPRVPGKNKHRRFIPAQSAQEFSRRLNNEVEQYTFTMLMHPRRPGGPLDKTEAHRLARQEKLRHEAMYPLREFVMRYYRPVSSPDAPMLIFRRKSAP